MKYENFPECKRITDQINDLREELRYLNADNVSIQIFAGQYKIETIGAWSDCEHSHKDLAIKFRNDLIQKLESKVAVLMIQLEKL